MLDDPVETETEMQSKEDISLDEYADVKLPDLEIGPIPLTVNQAR